MYAGKYLKKLIRQGCITWSDGQAGNVLQVDLIRAAGVAERFLCLALGLSQTSSPDRGLTDCYKNPEGVEQKHATNVSLLPCAVLFYIGLFNLHSAMIQMGCVKLLGTQRTFPTPPPFGFQIQLSILIYPEKSAVLGNSCFASRQALLCQYDGCCCLGFVWHIFLLNNTPICFCLPFHSGW